MRGFEIGAGETVEYEGQGYEILKVLNTDWVSARHLKTDAIETLQIAQLKPFGANRSPTGHARLSDLTEEQRNFCDQCLEVIRPLLFKRNTLEEVKARARLAKRHISTIYRWVQKYERSRSPLVFLVTPPDGGKNKGRVSTQIEAIIKEKIDAGLKQRFPKKKIFKNIEEACAAEGLKRPSYPTVLARWKKVPQKDNVAAHSLEEAETLFGLKPGHYSGAKWPLSIVQIDHAEINLVLVGDVYREPIGRPWLTIAIDVFSRCIVGIYLSMESPSGFSVGQCLSMGILRKEEFLAKLGLEAYPWEIYGYPDVVHADNGSDFRAGLLKETCKGHGIDLIWRPVKKPRYGGHIEALIGDFKKTIKELPGTTHLNPKDRGDDDSKKTAALTFTEFLRWLVREVIKHNHAVHSGIERVPHEKYLEGILVGSNTVGARGICPADDPRRLVIDFLPFTERTIQQEGVAIDKVHYFGEELVPWIYNGEGAKRKFFFHRDYRDVSFVYFLDPTLDEYFKIFAPIKPISLWERRHQRRKELDQKNAEGAIYLPLVNQLEQEQQQEVEEAKTKTARKRLELKKMNRGPFNKPDPPPPKPQSTPPPVILETPIIPLDDIESW